MLLINNKRLMGKYTNKVFNNIIGWSTVVVLVSLSVMLIILPLLQK